jgi:hypothetical protein
MRWRHGSSHFAALTRRARCDWRRSVLASRACRRGWRVTRGDSGALEYAMPGSKPQWNLSGVPGSKPQWSAESPEIANFKANQHHLDPNRAIRRPSRPESSRPPGPSHKPT